MTMIYNSKSCPHLPRRTICNGDVRSSHQNQSGIVKSGEPRDQSMD
ncbi:predicted protein [Botrytis cinerea T4]|uniref:Uncharacterized protein n=1 Tax=Botryotinia fuckeliana (strain T4) TaxID=999810 RepID=G2Y4H3_BOTF4|nr:predicted protein [Botrytis cinerea T4]